MSKNNNTPIGCLFSFIVIIVVIILAAITLGIVGMFNTNEYTLTVTDKEVKNSKEHSKYLIFTEDKDGHTKVLQNTDSTLKWKFNSSDIYAELDKGKTYKFNVYGFRIPFLSKYENIDTYEEVK
ncbi:hypothetical protein ACQKJG_18420 [Priestia megaterium]|uniref:hypothetical protein n=1 Tax=Priestia megaterium TaxID=1404 RepID=UPI003CFF496D